MMKKLFPKFATLMMALVMVLCCAFTACAPQSDGPDPDGGQETPEKTLSSITLDDSKVKKDYKVGEKFDPTGLVVTAVYSDKSEEKVTDYTYSPSGELQESDKTVTVTYQKKRATISITVVDDTPPEAAPAARWITDWKEGVDPYDAAKWLLPKDQPEGKDFSRLVAPEITGEDIKITGASRLGSDVMGIVDENGKILNPTHNKVEAGHDALNDQEIVYSMNLKATGHFGILLFCTTGAAWDNAEQYRSIMVEFNNGEVNFRMQRPGDEVVATGKAAISSTEYTRVDFAVTRRGENSAFDLKLFVGGYAVKLTGSACAEGMISSGVNGYGQNIEFVALDESTLYLNAPHATTPTPQPDENIPEIEGVTARWIGSWQKDDKFFDPTAWMATAADADEMASKGTGPDTLAAPTLETDGSLKVTGHSRAPSNYMAIRDENNTILNPLHNKDDHDALMDQPIVYSMLLKTEGHFGIMLFAGSKIGWTSEDKNAYRAIFVEYNDGTFTFKAEQNIGNVIATVNAPLSADKFTRVDFVFTRKTVDGAKKCEMKFYVDGKAQTLEGNEALSFELKGYGQHMQFSALDGKALWIAAPKNDN